MLEYNTLQIRRWSICVPSDKPGGSDELCPLLLDQVRRLGLHAQLESGVALRLVGDEIEKVVADVTDIDSLGQAIEGCDTVYINLNAKMDFDKYESIEIKGTQNIAHAATERGIKRISMISGLTKDLTLYLPQVFCIIYRHHYGPTSSGTTESLQNLMV